MNRTQTFLTTSILALSLFAGALAEATVTTFDNRPDWEAVAGTAQTTDFSTTDSGAPITNPPGEMFFPSLSLKGVTYLNVNSYYNDFIYVNPGNVIRINLPANTKAFGMDITPVVNTQGEYTIVLSNGEVFNSIAGFFPGQDDFFGVTSPDALEWIEISLNTTSLGIEKFSHVAVSPILPVAIDIIPGLRPNFVAYKSNLPIPVAILSSAAFDASSVTPSTVRFGASGTEAPAASYLMVDVNRDGRKDMVLFFFTRQTGIIKTTVEGKLTGETNSGTSFAGSDSIQTLGK